LNHRAEVIETTKSNIDLRKVLNTGKFNFEEAANHKQWLDTDRYAVQTETEKYEVSSFIYKSERPFNPERLRKILDDSFLLRITNNDHTHGHEGHDHGHDHGEGEEYEEGKDEEEDDDEEE